MKSSLCAALLLLWSMALAAAEPAETKIDVGPYRITVPATWKAAEQRGRNKRLIAMRFSDEKQTLRTGEILAASLTKSATEESDELLAGIKDKPEVGTLIESGDFVTKAGAKGKKVLIKLKAADMSYGSPVMFYSIYLPQLEGSVTFKLRCAPASFETNKTDFETMIAAAEAVPSKP